MSRLRKVLSGAGKVLGQNTALVPNTGSVPAPAISKAKKYVTDGPQLYISMLLNKKSPLTSQQIWNEYQKDAEAQEQELFQSKTYLKRKVLSSMEQQNKVYKAGYSQLNQKSLGFKLNPDSAFNNVHPDIIVQLDPKPEFKRPKLAKIINPEVTVE